MTDKDELQDGPWFRFPATCTHGCGTYYSLDEIFRTPCIGADGELHHHDFSFPNQER